MLPDQNALLNEIWWTLSMNLRNGNFGKCSGTYSRKMTWIKNLQPACSGKNHKKTKSVTKKKKHQFRYTINGRTLFLIQNEGSNIKLISIQNITLTPGGQYTKHNINTRETTYHFTDHEANMFL